MNVVAAAIAFKSKAVLRAMAIAPGRNRLQASILLNLQYLAFRLRLVLQHRIHLIGINQDYHHRA